MGETKLCKNFLLLSMSVLPRNLEENYYRSFDNDYFRGVSQLEPDTKYFLRSLQKNDEKLDKIFIITSPEAADESIDINKLTPFLYSPTQFISENAKTASAVAFYEDRIWQYIEGNEKTNQIHSKGKDEKIALAFEAEKYEKDKDDKKNKFLSLQSLYQDPSKLFDPVPYTEEKNEAIYTCVKDLCEKICDETDEEVQINLFVDMQGARRYETFIINATIKLLEIRNIRVKQSVAIDYLPDHNENGLFHDIVDTTINDRILELVSGMNEFIRTGRGDTLYDFQEHVSEMQSSDFKLDAEKDIINSIKNISDSISLCACGKFDKGLSDFKASVKHYDENKAKKNPLFQIFVKDLKTDYSENHLLDKGKNTAVNQVKWCMKKKLYQQALTLVETKFPNDIVRNKIFYYSDTQALKDLLDLFGRAGWDGAPKYNWNNYKDKSRIEVKPDKAQYVWIKYVFETKNVNSLSFTKKLLDLKKVNLKIEKRPPVDEVKKVVELLKFYSQVCLFRNEVNHASGKQFDINALEILINHLLQQFYHMIDDGNRVSIDMSDYIVVKTK